MEKSKPWRKKQIQININIKNQKDANRVKVRIFSNIEVQKMENLDAGASGA
jgi:hypothetical protein